LNFCIFVFFSQKIVFQKKKIKKKGKDSKKILAEISQKQNLPFGDSTNQETTRKTF